MNKQDLRNIQSGLGETVLDVCMNLIGWVRGNNDKYNNQTKDYAIAKKFLIEKLKSWEVDPCEKELGFDESVKNVIVATLNDARVIGIDIEKELDYKNKIIVITDDWSQWIRLIGKIKEKFSEGNILIGKSYEFIFECSNIPDVDIDFYASSKPEKIAKTFLNITEVKHIAVWVCAENKSDESKNPQYNAINAKIELEGIDGDTVIDKNRYSIFSHKSSMDELASHLITFFK